MTQLFKNNASGVLSVAATAIATTLTLGAGQGALFPNPSGGDHFLATLIGLDVNGNESLLGNRQGHGARRRCAHRLARTGGDYRRSMAGRFPH